MLRILHQTDSLLVLNKPAGLVCHPTKGDDTTSLVGRLRLHLGPMRPFHLINRLDRETSGITLVALEDGRARELRRAWEQRHVRKNYLAMVRGHPDADILEIDAPLGRDESSPVAIKNCVRADGAPSRTKVVVRRRFTRAEGRFALLDVQPESGRKHQIRIHLAHAGFPIVGDKIYGGDPTIYLRFVEGRLSEADRTQLLLANHALHARAIELPGLDGLAERFETAPEPEFTSFCAV